MKKTLILSLLLVAVIVAGTIFSGAVVEAGRRGVVEFEKYRGRTWVLADGTVVERTRARGFRRGGRAADCAGRGYAACDADAGSCQGSDYGACDSGNDRGSCDSGRRGLFGWRW